MISPNHYTPVGLLFSGGLESCLLLGHLLEQGHWVQPLYLRTQLAAEREELLAVVRLLRAMRAKTLDKLVTLDVPVSDLYAEQQLQLATAPREFPSQEQGSVRNLPEGETLMQVKAILWCQLRGMTALAMGSRGCWPSGVRDDSLDGLMLSPSRETVKKVRLFNPLSHLDRRQMMQLGWDYPLELTFSCVAPVHGLHCGDCVKCTQRRTALQHVGREDTTRYARTMWSQPHL